MTVDEAPRSKAELLQRQHVARAIWEALLARVPSERIAEPGVKGDLSAKDIVAHLAVWERHAAHRLRLLSRGETPEPLPPPGMTWQEYEHASNARVFREWRDRTWAEVRTEAADAYREFIATAQAAPEEILFAPERPAWQIIAFNGYLHYEDFAPALRVWLERPQR